MGGKWRKAASSSAEPASEANTDTTASTDTAPNSPALAANGADPLPTNNDPTTNGPSQQTDSPDPDAAGGVLERAAVAAVAAVLNPAGAVSSATLPAKDGANDNDKTGTADPGNATPGTDQPSANPQPVAAAFVLNTALGAAPAAANGKPTSAIDEQTKPRAGLTPSIANNQNTSTHDANDTTAAQTAPAAQSTTGDQSSGSAANGNTAAPPQPGTGAQQGQAQTQASNNAAVLTQSVVAATGVADRVGGRGDASASTMPSGAAGATNAPTANGTPSVLPNFGFLAASAMTAGAAAAVPANTGTAVPLAGLAVAIAARAQAGSNQFDIRLDPPELGRIDVRLDVDRNGQVTSHVTVDRADTLQLLQSHQPQLEQALQQAGLKTADNGLQFTLRDQSFAGQNGGGSSNGNGNGQPNTARLVIPDAQAAPVDTAQIYSRLYLGSGLDIRV